MEQTLLRTCRSKCCMVYFSVSAAKLSSSPTFLLIRALGLAPPPAEGVNVGEVIADGFGEGSAPIASGDNDGLAGEVVSNKGDQRVSMEEEVGSDTGGAPTALEPPRKDCVTSLSGFGSGAVLRRKIRDTVGEAVV